MASQREGRFLTDFLWRNWHAPVYPATLSLIVDPLTEHAPNNFLALQLRHPEKPIDVHPRQSVQLARYGIQGMTPESANRMLCFRRPPLNDDVDAGQCYPFLNTVEISLGLAVRI
jgi:hypothetical protein